MAQTHEGAMRVLARKSGVDLVDLELRHARGEKWCYRCRLWKPIAEYTIDRSRYDGRASLCCVCRSTRTAPGPSIRERRENRHRGLAWCSGCKAWLAVGEVSRGSCRAHRAAYERRRYSTDENYRKSRQHRSAQRRRGVAPVCLEAQLMLTEKFGGLCAYCDNVAIGYDHIEPVSNGGETLPGYVVPACATCNSRKKNLTLDDFVEKYGIAVKQELIDVIVLQFCWPA